MKQKTIGLVIFYNCLGAIFACLTYWQFAPDAMPVWPLFVIVLFLLWLSVLEFQTSNTSP